MAGAMGWVPSALREASLAEFWSHWTGFARAQGWLQERPEAMTRAELHELMERYPDG